MCVFICVSFVYFVLLPSIMRLVQALRLQTSTVDALNTKIIRQSTFIFTPSEITIVKQYT